MDECVLESELKGLTTGVSCKSNFPTFPERLNVLYERNWTLLVHEQLRRFEGSIVAATKGGLVETLGSDHRLGAPRWSFTEALIYSVTVITTIGKLSRKKNLYS